MSTLTRRVAALAIVPTLLLAGCGGSDDADATAANGDVIKGTGYSYSVPKGWSVPKKDVPGTEQTDSFAADLTDKDGFADNINVIRLDPAPVEDLDQLEKGLKSELETAGSQDVSVRDRVKVDGDEAVRVASTQERQGKKYLTEQYDAIHDGASYVITLSFSDSVSESDRDALGASILASWKWAA